MPPPEQAYAVPGRRSGRRLSRAAIAVGLATLLVTLGLWAIARRMVELQEQETLQHRADEPWLVLAGGLVSAALLTVLLEVMARRRDDALAFATIAERESVSILDAAREAFVAADLDGRICAWSEQAERLLGWTAEEVLGRPVVEVLVPPELRSRYGKDIDEIVAAGGVTEARRFEADVVDRSGRRFPVEVCLWRSASEDTVTNAIMHDITDRRRAADELVIARERALEASRMKSEFLATMSHEIRTPMNAVIGMTGLLLRTELDCEQRDYAETVRRSAEALLTVINDILDFSKIEAGRLDLELLDFELRTTVEEVADLLAEQAQEKGLELVTAIESEAPAVLHGDPGRLRQILLNLTSNAVKFTDEGEVVIRCSTIARPERPSERESRDDGRVTLRFEVRDTGCGVAAEDLDGLFASFTQADNSTTRRFGGTGLGLAIARQLTELMGGEIGATSTLGEGSTFWFTVVLDEVDEPVILSGAGRGLDGARVLIVDDNATNRRIVADSLTRWGMDVVEACGGEEAVEVFEQSLDAGPGFDLVLLDYHMPDADGLQVASRLQPWAGRDGTHLILLTSSGDRVPAARLDELGIACSLTKPVRQLILHDRIVATLNTLPATPVPGDDAEPRTDAAGPGPNVLVAEDNPVNQRVALRMLEKLGCVVDVVGNGEEAVQATLGHDYAIVFMDCQMPEMDGYEATREIRRREGAARHTPIVAMTAAAMAGDRERTLQAGMDDYVAKPVRFADLAAAVQQWRRGRPGEGDIATRRSARTRSGRQPPLDRAAVEELRAAVSGAAGGFLGLVEEFALTSTEQLRTMREAAAYANLDDVARLAHRLRGTTSTFGAYEATAAAEAVERAALAGRTSEVFTALDQLSESLERATAAVERLTGQART
jgi:two-component system sensor histidine kinase/response regulator